jgi:hypothetical protein
MRRARTDDGVGKGSQNAASFIAHLVAADCALLLGLEQGARGLDQLPGHARLAPRDRDGLGGRHRLRCAKLVFAEGGGVGGESNKKKRDPSAVSTTGFFNPSSSYFCEKVGSFAKQSCVSVYAAPPSAHAHIIKTSSEARPGTSATRPTQSQTRPNPHFQTPQCRPH